MSNVLRFEIAERPLGVNNLYANGAPKKTATGKTYVPRVASRESKAYKERIRQAALSAASSQGWDLGYGGTASITIIDYRKGRQGVDIDAMNKAVQDAIQPRRRNPVPTPLGDDREIWASHAYIANDDNERIVVIVRKTTREAIGLEAKNVDLQAFGEIYGVVEPKPSQAFIEAQAEARRRMEKPAEPKTKPRTLEQMKSGDVITDEREAEMLLRRLGLR